MYVLETTLLVVAYSLIILTLFLQVVCFKRNIERLESIGFTASLLLLILCFSISYYSAQKAAYTNVFSQGAMILIGLTTPLQILQERRHSLSSNTNKLVIGIGAFFLIGLILAYILELLIYFQYAVAVYLGISVMAAMLLVVLTKPVVMKAKREKSERAFAIAFLIVVPIYLLVSFTSDAVDASPSLGMALSMIFILLSASKLREDMERLSLFKDGHQAMEQNLSNYGFTNREKEIATLLIQGTSYQDIADQLHISMPTVKTHASNIYRKGQVKNRAALILLLSQTALPKAL